MQSRNIRTIGTNIWIDDKVDIGENVTIGHGSCIGYGSGEKHTQIGNNVTIGSFCTIESGCAIEDNVEIDCYCRVGFDTTIGLNSKILYATAVFNHVSVGKNCIIGGDLVDRVIVEDNVTFFGEIAHRHENPNIIWDVDTEPSPKILAGSVVGVKALIIGDVTIGPQAYVGAGEVVRTDVPPRMVLFKGKLTPLDFWRGVIQVRPTD